MFPPLDTSSRRHLLLSTVPLCTAATFPTVILREPLAMDGMDSSCDLAGIDVPKSRV
jgi:hypothetical protein